MIVWVLAYLDLISTFPRRVISHVAGCNGNSELLYRVVGRTERGAVGSTGFVGRVRRAIRNEACHAKASISVIPEMKL